MPYEFLPGGRNRLLAALKRQEENAHRRRIGVPPVAVTTEAAVE